MNDARWQALRSSIELMHANCMKFAEAHQASPTSQVGYYAQAEVLDVVLNEMTTIELDRQTAVPP